MIKINKPVKQSGTNTIGFLHKTHGNMPHQSSHVKGRENPAVVQTLPEKFSEWKGFGL
jgi:hypothetical protein